jgi:hypothetical protein
LEVIMSWKDILHYGGGALLVLAGLIGMAGVHLPGVQIDPATCIVTGLAVFGIGAKADQALKAVAIFIGGTLVYLSLSIGPVYAADALKAPVKQSTFLTGYPAESGWYWGMYGEVGAGTANGVTAGTIDANTGKIFSFSGNAGLLVGHTWCSADGLACYSAEFSPGLANLNAQSQGISLTGPLVFEESIIAATPLSTFANLSLIPNFNLFGNAQTPGLPGLPAGVTAGPGMLGLVLTLKEQDVSANFPGVGAMKAWEFALEGGIEMRWKLSNKTAAFSRTMYQAPSQALCLVGGKNAGCAGLGQGAYQKIGFAF